MENILGKKHEVRLKNGYNYDFYALSIDEAKGLIERYGGENLKEHANSRIEKKVYLLSNNKIVQTGFMDGFLFDSLEDYLVSMQVIINKRLPKYPFKKFIHTSEGMKGYYVHSNKKLKVQLKGTKELLFENEQFKVSKLDEGVLLYGSISNPLQFESYEDFNLIQIAMLDIGKRRPIMFGRNQYGASFTEKIDELCLDLYRYLKLPVKSICFTKEALYRIEKKIYSKVICDEFTEPLWIPLLAFIGKVVQLEEGGEWEMDYNEEHDTWTPNFRKPNGTIREWYKDLGDIFDPFTKSFIAIPKT